MDYRPCFLRHICLYLNSLHQLSISCIHLVSIHHGTHTVSADFFHICYSCIIYLLCICFFQALTDRVCGIAFRICRIVQKFPLFHILRSDIRYLKHTFCQCSSLIKYNVLRLGKQFQIARTLDQNSSCRCTADSSKKTKWNRDNQCTWTADYKKCQCTFNPFSKLCRISHNQIYHGRKDRKCKCGITDCRRIIFCKSRNKVLRS